MRYRLMTLILSTTAAGLFAPASAFAQVATFHACGAGPASNEVYIYQNASFGGTCAALYVGFYANPGTGTGEFGIGNDDVSSIKVGSGVNARAFADIEYGSSFTDFTGGTSDATMPTGWDNSISSIRVTLSSRSLSCNDLVLGEFAIFGDINFGGDCVVLHYNTTYNTPDDFGFANDSISSVSGGPGNGCPPDFGPGQSMRLFSDINEGGSSLTIFSGTSVSDLRTDSFNDLTSSISTITICLD
jgi:hypothetical protein